VVAYLNLLERDLKNALALDDDREGEWNAYEKALTERSCWCVKVLISFATGPRRENQKAISHTNILAIVNRMLPFCRYTLADLKAPEAGQAKSPRRQLRGALSRLLLVMLEGHPEPDVVRSDIHL
jgi:hypothetical protein